MDSLSQTSTRTAALSLNDLATALDGDVSGEWVRAPGPGHSSVDRSLSVRPSRRARDGFIVATFSPADTKEECRAYVLERLAELDPDLTPTEVPERPSTQRDTLSYAKRLWAEARGVSRDLVKAYLAARSIPQISLPPDIRCHQGIRQGSAEWPAMLALIRRANDGEPIGLHVTFLKADGSGKAPIEPNRRIYGAFKGGVVKLQRLTDQELVLSEGLESGFADIVMRRSRPKFRTAATWSALAAGNLHSLSLPPKASLIRVLSDGDRAASAAITKAYLRWRHEGRETRIIRFGDGIDANDYLIQQSRNPEP